MTALSWIIRLLLFAFLLAFALQNTGPVALYFVPAPPWQAPLVVVLFIFFAGGVLLGILSVLGVIYRQRREISRLKREIAKLPGTSTTEPQPIA